MAFRSISTYDVCISNIMHFFISYRNSVFIISLIKSPKTFTYSEGGMPAGTLEDD